MPKVVDHEARRRELAAAVWRVIAARGPDAITIRDVAAEAGWSSGALRHYLPTREELLVFAFRLAGERAGERIRAAGERAGDRIRAAGDAPRDRIRAAGEVPVARILEEVLPLDEERRQEALIWFAFVGLAPAHPTLAAELDRAYRDILARLERRVGDRAALLWAAVDGIAVQALAMPAVMTPARQRAALRLQMEAILVS